VQVPTILMIMRNYKTDHRGQFDTASTQSLVRPGLFHRYVYNT